jgi:hypothetical protein
MERPDRGLDMSFIRLPTGIRSSDTRRLVAKMRARFRLSLQTL